MEESKERCDCGACDRPNSADAKMVECGSCHTWYHLSCAGVSPGVEKRPWNCTKCLQSLPVPPATSKSKSKGVSQPVAPVEAKKSSRKPSAKSDAGSTIAGGQQLVVPEQTAGKPPTGTIPKATKASEPTCRAKTGNVKEDLLPLEAPASTPKKHPEIQKARLEEKRLLEQRKLKEEQNRLKKERELLEKEKALEEKELSIKAKALEVEEQYLEEKYDLEEQLAEDDQLSQASYHSGRSKVREWIDQQQEQDDVGGEVPPAPQEVEPLEPQGEVGPNQPDNHSRDQVGDLGPRREQGQERGPNVPRIVAGQEECALNLTANQLTARHMWPKKLPTFSGEPEEWPIFYSSFVNANAACGFSNVENVIRLQESLKGPAREAVVTKLMFPNSVPSIMETLRRLYGRPELLVKNLLGKVRRLEAPKPERLDTLINFGMAIQQLCDHLEAANLRSHLANPTLLEELVEKLPATIKLDWVRWKRAYEDPSLKEFGEFMDNLVVDASEVTTLIAPRKETVKAEKSRSSQKGHVHTHSDSADNPKDAPTRKPCPICSKVDHRVRNCDRFKQMALDSRLKAVEQYKLCEVCLFDHGNWRCKSRFHCNVGNCRLRHHPLLHRTEPGPVTRAEVQAHTDAKRTVLFRIVPITLYYGTRSFDTYGFLDEGSSLTLVEVSVAHKLGVEGVPEPLELAWTSNVVRKEKTSQRVDLMVSGRGETERFKLSSVHTVNALSLPKQSLQFHKLAGKLSHLQDLPVLSYMDAEPKVLIGLQNLELFAPLENRIGQPGEPIAVRSVLGWTIYGPCEAQSETGGFLGHICKHDEDRELNEMIRQRFILEDIGACAALPESAEVKRAREILDRTTTRKDGRFVTGLLWRRDEIRFPNSLPMAIKRMKSLEVKLARDPDLRNNVHQQIREYIEKNYAHKATEEELAEANPNRVWYLPLNVVSHPKKPEKKRLVWDAAAQVDGVSLNSQLLKGPDLLIQLIYVICKFRERRVGFGGDIEKMFHQIRIILEDLHSQRFLFRFDPSLPPDIYLMAVATFGAACSPCSAQYVMHRNADEFAEEFPESAAAIKQKTYMDDYFDSADTPQEAAERAQQVKFIHSQAGFNMRNWVSNSVEVLHSLGETSKQSMRPVGSDQGEDRERVLGMLWDPNKDCFSFSNNWQDDLAPYVCDNHRPTKRTALRCIMSLFDPLGLLAPFLIHGRMLIQDMWRTGMAWDEEVSDEVLEKWRRWTDLLPMVYQLQIPRCYFGDAAPESYRTLQLHVFTDASENGYGCAAYFRIVGNGRVRCSLVMAKSKVAPLKYQSIPRLELQGALLGARLMKSVCESHTLKIDQKFLWTDSSTVLAWIRSEHRKYKQYVAHRVGEILTLSEPENWRWVPSKENVADCLTKWGNDTEPSSSGRWLNGPSFLYLSEEEWPQQRQPAETTEELRTHILLHRIAVPENLVDASRISKWKVLVRIVAFVHRFISNCRLRAQGHPIEAVKATPVQEKLLVKPIPAKIVPLCQQEFLKAEMCLWRAAQSECYPDEMRVLLNNWNKPVEELLSVEKSSPLYKLTPFVDEYGVIRMEGRTANAAYAAFDTRFPIVMPKDHPITQRLVEYYHSLFGHANKETVVNELRQRYFIHCLRATVDRVARNCQKCKVAKCKPQFPRMAPLPKQRLTPYVKPFSYVGVDYLGPLEVTVGRRKEKRYVVVFTCLVVRAVHLELAYSLTTDSCIMAIRRFTCKWGSPVEIFSDNGTNFVGASRELQEQINRINDDCCETFTGARTKWSFNPPAGPHMGGVWERMVRSVKETMRALEDGRKLNDEILLTVLAETEDIINARPLTYMPQGPTESEALTPNHLLFGESARTHEELREPVDLADALRSSYKRSQFLSQVAWERWLKEYFPTVNRRTKWLEEAKQVKVGDLVYVAEGNRRSWVRGRVEEVVEGGDGRVRQAVVQTATGRLKRPVVKLAVMEVTGGGESGEDHGGPLPDPRGGGCSGSTDNDERHRGMQNLA